MKPFKGTLKDPFKGTPIKAPINRLYALFGPGTSLFKLASTWMVVKIGSLFGYPKKQSPHYNRDPKRDHNFDNYPLPNLVQGALIGSFKGTWRVGGLSRILTGIYRVP